MMTRRGEGIVGERRGTQGERHRERKKRVCQRRRKRRRSRLGDSVRKEGITRCRKSNNERIPTNYR